MTDRELLELAAKAAGYEYGIIHQRPHVRCDAGWTPWNPIDDDGAALRLAVARNIGIVFRNDGLAVTAMGNGCFAEEKVTMGYPVEEATRRAIVRAAAEIGRSMIHNV